MYDINFIDIIILIINILLLLFLIQKSFYRYKNTTFGKYFTYGLILKICGGFFHYIYHRYVYSGGGGDTFQYYNVIMEIKNAWTINPYDVTLSFFQAPENYSVKVTELIHHQFYYDSEESLTVKIGFLLGLTSFSSFLSIGMWHSVFSYWGIWRMFKTFCTICPAYSIQKYIAFVCLFSPSLVFWASSISKDALIIGGLGFFIHIFYIIFFKQKFSIFNFFILFLSFYIVIVIKGYIMVAMMPACLVWIFLHYKNLIANPLIRRLSIPIFIFILFIIFFIGLDQAKKSSALGAYTSSEVFETAKIYADYLSDSNIAGSAYSIGDFEPNIVGVLKIVPAALVVTLFRPYPFEIKNAAMTLASLESFFTLLITLAVLFKVGMLNVFSFLFRDNFFLFSFLFVFIFSIAVGITSGNFGSLMRYKIPMLPFYFMMLILLYFNPKAKINK